MIRFTFACLVIALVGVVSNAHAQETTQVDSDTLIHVEMEQIVVSATQSVRRLEDVPVPVTIVSADEIHARGSLRLSELLSEQSGLIVAQGIGGDGVQIQGFDADYTLILIDGEPVVGRTGGTLDLERLAVTGVERIEIVKGPLSARYGSEALAGVINIITRKPAIGTTANGMFTLESQGATDFSLEADTGSDNWGIRLFLNRYGSNGHSIQPSQGTLVVPELSDYSSEIRARYTPSEQTELGFHVRGAFQSQEGRYLLGDDLYSESSNRTDWSINPTVRHRISNTVSTQASLYGARFENSSVSTEESTEAILDETSFAHDYGKGDLNLTWIPSQKHMITLGGGVIGERVGGERYTAPPTSSQPYAYAEYSWMPIARLDLVASGRFDAPSDYDARLTPKIAVLFRALDWLRFRGSVGSGYKAPDFRQRYLSFTNGVVGYSVFGAQEAQAELAALDEAGGIDRYLLDPASFGVLEAESSTAFGLGLEAEPVSGILLKVNAFHNEVRDLIDTQPIAVKTNGQQVFSYFNLDRIYTRGIEAEVFASVLNSDSYGSLTGSAGYQYLETADRDILELIYDGSLFRRDENGQDVRVTRADYGGLFGRSKHSGTASLTHRLSRLNLTSSLRAIWRSQYGFQDANGNLALDTPGEYAPGYTLLHLTVSKGFGRAEVRAGIRNITNHTDTQHLPSETGRVFFAGAGYRF